MEFDEFGFADFENFGIGFGGGIHVAVAADEFGDRVLLESLWVELGFPAVQNHAELRAPVADVVVGDDGEAEKFRDAGERVAEDGGANVPDVHRFGDVGGGKVDDDGFSLSDVGGTEFGVVRNGFDLLGEGLGGDAEIEEAGACDFGGSEIFELEGVENLGGEGAWVGALGFGKRHGDVALIIAEAEVVGMNDGAGLGGSGYGEDCLLEEIFEFALNRHGKVGAMACRTLMNFPWICERILG